MNEEQVIEQIAKLEKELAELKTIINKPESYGRERVEKGVFYWHIRMCGAVEKYKEYFNNTDRKIFNMGNYYHTKEEAEKARDRQLAYVRITDAIREQNKGWMPDWSDATATKYTVFKHYHHLRVDNHTICQILPNELYGTKEAIDYVIEHYSDDIKLYLGVE